MDTEGLQMENKFHKLTPTEVLFSNDGLDVGCNVAAGTNYKRNVTTNVLAFAGSPAPSSSDKDN